MVSRLDLVVLELAAAGTIFHRRSRVFLEICEFIELKGGGTEAWVGQHTPGRAWPPGAARCVLPTSFSVSDTSSDPQLSSSPKKSTKSFAAFGLRLIGIFCKSKTGQKIATGTWHYVNRLVPKNDINLIGNHSKISKIDHKTARNNQKL